MEVWNNRFEKFRNREWARQGECADCNLFRYCEGNGMHLHDESGKLMTCHYHRLWDCLTSFRQFFFIKKNKAFLLKISLKAFSVSD